MANNTYVKTKDLSIGATVDEGFDTNAEGAFKVRIDETATDLVISYLTNLYSNAPVAVVRELFTNAVDAGGTDPIKLTIEPDGEGTYTFSVVDYGCGMSNAQLKANYVAYANSSKRTDMSVVGAFGIGSKSPLTISEGFTVESCDGNERGVARMAITDRGVWAKVDALGALSVTYTKVTVPHISHANAVVMADYIAEKVIPYAQVAVDADVRIAGYDFRPKKFAHAIPVPFYAGYDVTVYCDDHVDALRVWSNSDRYTNAPLVDFAQRVRIGSITYPLNRYEASSWDPHYVATVIIDVEPGLIQFAPSRESLPNTEFVSNLKSTFKSRLFAYGSMLEALLTSEYLDDIVLASLREPKYSAAWLDAGCRGLSEDFLHTLKQAAKSPKLRAFISDAIATRKLMSDVTDTSRITATTLTATVNHYGDKPFSRKKRSTKYRVDGAVSDMVAFLRNMGDFGRVTVDVVDGCKVSRKTQDVVLPPAYRPRAVEATMADGPRDAVRADRDLPNRVAHIGLCVADGETADAVERAAKVAKGLCATPERVTVNRVTADYDRKETAERKPRTAVEDREIAILTMDGEGKATTSIKNLSEAIDVVDGKLWGYKRDDDLNRDYDTLYRVSAAYLGKPMVVFHGDAAKLKTVRKYIGECLDMDDCLDFDYVTNTDLDKENPNDDETALRDFVNRMHDAAEYPYCFDPCNSDHVFMACLRAVPELAAKLYARDVTRALVDAPAVAAFLTVTENDADEGYARVVECLRANWTMRRFNERYQPTDLVDCVSFDVDAIVSETNAANWAIRSLYLGRDVHHALDDAIHGRMGSEDGFNAIMAFAEKIRMGKHLIGKLTDRMLGSVTEAESILKNSHAVKVFGPVFGELDPANPMDAPIHAAITEAIDAAADAVCAA